MALLSLGPRKILGWSWTITEELNFCWLNQSSKDGCTQPESLLGQENSIQPLDMMCTQSDPEWKNARITLRCPGGFSPCMFSGPQSVSRLIFTIQGCSIGSVGTSWCPDLFFSSSSRGEALRHHLPGIRELCTLVVPQSLCIEKRSDRNILTKLNT